MWHLITRPLVEEHMINVQETSRRMCRSENSELLEAHVEEADLDAAYRAKYVEPDRAVPVAKSLSPSVTDSATASSPQEPNRTVYL